MNSIRPNFSSIFSTRNVAQVNQAHEQYQSGKLDKNSLLYPNSTMMFRDYLSYTAALKLLKNEPADIHILGASDGSEAFSYVVTARRLYGERAKTDIAITAIDKDPAMIGLAKTGHVVCGDHEQILWNQSNLQPFIPLSADGVIKHLSLSDEPKAFSQLLKRYPKLKQVVSDLVTGVRVGKGLRWYKVDKDALPNIDFKEADIKSYVKSPKNSKKNQIYVISNSLKYEIMGPQDSWLKIPAFFKVFEDIINANQGKSTYIVLGGMEEDLIKRNPFFQQLLYACGIEKISKGKLKKIGIPDPNNMMSAIYKLNTNKPSQLTAFLPKIRT